MKQIIIGLSVYLISFLTAAVLEISGLVLHPAYWFFWGAATGITSMLIGGRK